MAHLYFPFENVGEGGGWICYLLRLFHALDNPIIPNAKYKCDFIYHG
jgi:hypothetical protein